jgi:hypothetical protein
MWYCVLTASCRVPQVETYFAKFASDKAYKQEYIKLWGEQRRYVRGLLRPTLLVCQWLCGVGWTAGCERV